MFMLKASGCYPAALQVDGGWIWMREFINTNTTIAKAHILAHFMFCTTPFDS
jgi:hypothetical protein